MSRRLFPVVASIGMAGALASAASATTPDKIATAIEKRLAQARLMPYSTESNYVGSGLVRPTHAYEVFTGPRDAHPVYFGVSVYKSAALAKRAYAEALARAAQLGSGSSFRAQLSGRVIYLAYTYVPSGVGNPPVPSKTFQALVAIAKGSY